MTTDKENHEILSDLLYDKPFLFISFRKFLQEREYEWLLLFWLDSEFYLHIKKQRTKLMFAKQVYGKYMLTFVKNESLSIYNNEIALKIKASAVDQDIFLNAQYKAATLLIQFYNIFTSQIKCKKSRRPKSNPVGEKEKLSKEDDANLQYFIEKMFNPQTGIFMKERKHRLRTIPNCFIGSELVDWIMRNIYFKNNRNKAIKFGQKVMIYDGGIFRCVNSKGGELKDDNTYYQLLKYIGNDFFRRSSRNLLEISLSEDIKDNIYENKDEEIELCKKLGAIDNKAKKKHKKGGSSRDNKNTIEKTPIRVQKTLKGPFTPTDYMNKPLNRTFRTRSKHMSAPNFKLTKKIPKSGYDGNELSLEPQRLDFDGKINENKFISKNTIEDFLHDENYIFVEAIALLPIEIKDLRRLAKSVVKIFCYQGRDICGMVSHILAMNFRSGYNLETYFNRNTFEVLIIDIFSSLVCKDWIRGIFESVAQTCQELDIDLQNETSIYSEIIIDKISGSVHKCPYSFRLLCSLFKNLEELDSEQVTIFLRKFIVKKFYSHLIEIKNEKSLVDVSSELLLSMLASMEYLNDLSSCKSLNSNCECNICRKFIKSPRNKHIKSIKRGSTIISNPTSSHESNIKAIDAFVCRLCITQHLHKEVFSIKKSKKLDEYYQIILNIITVYSNEVTSYLEDKHKTHVEYLNKLIGKT